MDLVKALEKIRKSPWPEIPNDLDLLFANILDSDLEKNYHMLINNYEHMIEYGTYHHNETISAYWFPIFSIMIVIM